MPASRRLTYRDLPGLGGILKLPSGWSYSSKTLTSTLKLNSDGMAYVINDKLLRGLVRS